VRKRATNLKLNKNKCQVRKTKVPHGGHLLTIDGVKPDPDKFKAIEEMVPPTNKK